MRGERKAVGPSCIYATYEVPHLCMYSKVRRRFFSHLFGGVQTGTFPQRTARTSLAISDLYR